jgi:hypothetical protein
MGKQKTSITTIDALFAANVGAKQGTICPAEFGVSAPRAACSFWQWSAGAAVPGITDDCDCDVYLGTVEELEG